MLIRIGKTKSFNVGEKVLLKNTHLNPDVYVNSPSKKLLPKYSGPYKITERIGHVAYKLKFDKNIRSHPVFHVSVLRRYNHDENREVPPPPPVIINNEIEYEVEKILDTRIRRNKNQYLIKWKGYPMYDSTWESEDNIKNTQSLLKEFWKSKK